MYLVIVKLFYRHAKMPVFVTKLTDSLAIKIVYIMLMIFELTYLSQIFFPCTWHQTLWTQIDLFSWNDLTNIPNQSSHILQDLQNTVNSKGINIKCQLIAPVERLGSLTKNHRPIPNSLDLNDRAEDT